MEDFNRGMTIAVGCVSGILGATLAVRNKRPVLTNSLWFAVSGSLSTHVFIAIRPIFAEKMPLDGGSTQATMLASSVTGFVLGSMLGGGLRASLLGAITGPMITGASEIAYAEYRGWKFKQMVVQRHPELFETKQKESTAEFTLPEWLPIRKKGAVTRLMILEQQIRTARGELATLELQYQQQVALGTKPENPASPLKNA